MTTASISAMRGSMRNGWFLLLCLIASSLVMTATVHAREWIGDMAVECSGAVHSDNDADQTQGDNDKAAPHHHASCDGHFIGLPAYGQAAPEWGAQSQKVIAGVSALRPRSVDPALRPPTA